MYEILQQLFKLETNQDSTENSPVLSLSILLLSSLRQDAAFRCCWVELDGTKDPHVFNNSSAGG